ncbi:MAG: energy transducer TonB [Verrucomicrobiota bacterium]
MQRKEQKPVTSLFKNGIAIALGLVGTFLLFLVLPITQQINDSFGADSTVREAPVVITPPPPDFIEEEPPPEEPEPEPEPEPIELNTEALSLDQLNLDGSSLGGGKAIGIDISSMLAKATQQVGDDIMDSGMLDSQPKPIFQTPPRYPNELRKEKKKGQVYLVFVVNKNGRVENPSAKRATHPAFEKAAIDAVKQWKFEPATRDGKAVAAKMSIPITFSPSS